MSPYILALDQGTTSSRSIIFNSDCRAVAQVQQEFEQITPTPGHVEHDPEAIWQTQLGTARSAIEQAGVSVNEIAAIGIANQRETTILWDRETGRPIANALVWQSRISNSICRRLRERGLEQTVREKTGLVIDPYFSATKIMYLLEQDADLRRRAEAGEVLFGTVDSFLAWRLTGGKRHVTDVSNASRTMLMNIHSLDWDQELLDACEVPRSMLPEILPTGGTFGVCDRNLLGAELPIMAMAGDQQAATYGQACFEKGQAKNTYGTGCFLVMNTGRTAVASRHGLLTTVGWQVNGEVTYCLEGSVFVAGAVTQWLRDGLNIIGASQEVEPLASSVKDSDGVVFVPAFVGLGAPHWDPDARGAIFGLTRGTTKAHIARAALESIAFQTADLVTAMQNDLGTQIESMRVDGGACNNDLLMQMQADLLDCRIQRPVQVESTALGAACLAGVAAGIWSSESELQHNWQLDREFTCSIDAEERKRRMERWNDAISRVRTTSTNGEK